MNATIPDPKRGRDIIDWAAPVTERLNAFGDKVGAAARNERDRRFRAAPGCWVIVTGVDDDGNVVHLFDNQYALVGEVLEAFAFETPLESFFSPEEPDEGSEYHADDLPFVCLRVPVLIPATDSNGGDLAPGLVAYHDLGEVKTAQRDLNFVTVLLYQLTRECRVKVDFRGIPEIQKSEVL